MILSFPSFPLDSTLTLKEVLILSLSNCRLTVRGEDIVSHSYRGGATGEEGWLFREYSVRGGGWAAEEKRGHKAGESERREDVISDGKWKYF